MKEWINMVSCNDIGFEELHNLLRNGSGCYIFDNIILPDTFHGSRCRIEFRYYSESKLVLIVTPNQTNYCGKNKQIKNWAARGYEEFSSFAALKSFLQSFKNDSPARAPHSPFTPRNRGETPSTEPNSTPDATQQAPKMHYDKDSLTVPESGKGLIMLDKDTLIINLKSEIFGQDDNIEKIAHLVCNHLSTKRKVRPLSIYLYGVTGVGKSATVEALVNEINKQLDRSQRIAYVQVDCAQHKGSADITRITGAPPGYVGHDEPGVFSIVEENPCTFFVFEEVEKAASNITEVIMQAMETGKQETNGKTLKNGNTYWDLSNCVFFFTSNVVLEEKKRNLGFARDIPEPTVSQTNRTSDNIARRIGDETREARIRLAESGKFKREVIGRMHAIFKFNPLTDESIKDIAAKCIRDTAAKSHLLYITELDTPILQEFINVTAGQIQEFGARALRSEAEYYFNDAFRVYSHTHEDSAHIKVSGTLDNILISPSE